MIELKACPICKGEKWESLDHVRDQQMWYLRDLRDEGEPVGFKICEHCGFVTYDYKDEKFLEDHYNRERNAFGAENIITCNRKIKYHEVLLHDFFKTLTPDSKVLDFGCAQGYFLDHIRKTYGVKTENLTGVEHSDALLGWGRNVLGLDITKSSWNVGVSHFYDFISYYHVLEHLQNPEQHLINCRSWLKDDGRVYISVPLFFDELDNTDGSMTLDFEEYFHLNHINCFSKKSFHNLLKVCGFEIVKEDPTQYAYSVLCKKAKPTNEIETERWKEIKGIIERQKAAIDLAKTQRWEEAILMFPKYPDAYIYLSLNKDNMKNFEVQKEILNRGIETCSDNVKIRSQLARLYFQWDENKPGEKFYSNNIKKAEELFKSVFRDKAGNEDCLYFLGMIEAKFKGNYKKAIELWSTITEVNPMKFKEIMAVMGWAAKEQYKKDHA